MLSQAADIEIVKVFISEKSISCKIFYSVKTWETVLSLKTSLQSRTENHLFARVVISELVSFFIDLQIVASTAAMENMIFQKSIQKIKKVMGPKLKLEESLFQVIFCNFRLQQQLDIQVPNRNQRILNKFRRCHFLRYQCQVIYRIKG